MFFFFLDVDSSAISNISAIDSRSDNEATPNFSQTKNKEIKSIFPVAPWD